MQFHNLFTLLGILINNSFKRVRIVFQIELEFESVGF